MTQKFDIAALRKAAQGVPSGDDVLKLAHRKAWRFRITGNGNGEQYTFNKHTMLAFAADLLAMYRASEQAQRPPAYQRSTHHVHRGPESIPCFCGARDDHPIGQERAQQPPIDLAALLDRLEQAEKERDELRAGLPTIRIRVDATEALAGIEGVQEIVRDAARLEWLCLDLPTGPERAKQFEVIERLPMMSLSAAREAISAAMQGEGA